MQCAAGSIIAQMKIILLMRDLFYLQMFFLSHLKGVSLLLTKVLATIFKLVTHFNWVGWDQVLITLELLMLETSKQVLMRYK